MEEILRKYEDVLQTADYEVICTKKLGICRAHLNLLIGNVGEIRVIALLSMSVHFGIIVLSTRSAQMYIPFLLQLPPLYFPFALSLSYL